MKALISNRITETRGKVVLVIWAGGFRVSEREYDTAQEAFDALPEGCPCEVFLFPKVPTPATKLRPRIGRYRS